MVVYRYKARSTWAIEDFSIAKYRLLKRFQSDTMQIALSHTGLDQDILYETKFQRSEIEKKPSGMQILMSKDREFL